MTKTNTGSLDELDEYAPWVNPFADLDAPSPDFFGLPRAGPVGSFYDPYNPIDAPPRGFTGPAGEGPDSSWNDVVNQSGGSVSANTAKAGEWGLGYGSEDIEKGVVGASRSVFDALNKKSGAYQLDRNALEAQMRDKIDPYYRNLQDFGVEARSQASELARGWGDVGARGQEEMGGMFDQLRGYGDRQAERWGQEKGKIEAETAGQRARWDTNLEKVGAAGVGQKQTWADYLSGVDRSTEEVGRNYDVPKGKWESQVADPSQRGFDPATLQGMYARGAEQAQAGQSNTARQIAKLSAASGVGGTGTAFQNLQQAQERAQQAQLSGARDIGIAQGTAQREDLAVALQGLTQIGGLKGEDTARMLGIGLQGRQAMTGDEQRILGMEQAGLGAANEDVRGLMTLGTETERARAADLLNIQGMQKEALGQKADIGFKGLAGQGSAYEMGNRAQLESYGLQGEAQKTIGNYMDRILNTRTAESQDLTRMLEALDPQLRASGLKRGDPGFLENLGSAIAKAIGSILTKKIGG